MKNVLIDTDVILDFFFDRAPFAEKAAEVLSLCETGKIAGFVTPVIVSNVYYLLRQTAKHEKVIGNLTLLLSFLDVLNVDKHVIVSALGSKFSDFEDALQNYSAEHSRKVTTVVTRNVKDYKHSALSVMTPDAFVAALSLGNARK